MSEAKGWGNLDLSSTDYLILPYTNVGLPTNPPQSALINYNDDLYLGVGGTWQFLPISTPSLNDLTDVAITGPSNGQILSYNGTNWINTSPIGGGLNYQGVWNANTNTPTIPAAITGNNGYYYVVSTKGNTTIDTISDWDVGDWIISNGSSWQKLDGQNSFFIGESYGIVKTGINSTSNGTNLVSLYNTLKTYTPNGNALSTTNRVSLLVYPGIYTISDAQLIANTAYVDIIGIGSPENIIIVCDGTCLRLSSDNIIIKNITLQSQYTSSNPPSSTVRCCFRNDSSYPNTLLENVNMISYNNSFLTNMDVEFSGTYINVKGTCNSTLSYTSTFFGGKGIGLGTIASGTFKNCTLINNANVECSGFGGDDSIASGVFENCSVTSVFDDRSFGGNGGQASGTFINCKSTSSLQNYTFTNASGYLEKCKTISLSNQNYSFNNSTGNLIGCESNATSFSTYSSGYYYKCKFDYSYFSSLAGTIEEIYLDSTNDNNDTLSTVSNNCKIIRSEIKTKPGYYSINGAITGTTGIVYYTAFNLTTPYGPNFNNSIGESSAFNIKDVNI